MKNNKNIILFLVKFFVTYFLLTLIYSAYLNKTQQASSIFVCSPITKTVANQTQYVASALGYDIVTDQNEEELSMKLLYKGNYIAKVVEGCTSIGVIILFIAFIIAFSGKFKHMVLYILVGSILIYIVNLFRIIILTIALYKYPQYDDFLHKILFPLIIYGFTFILWIIWVNKFAIFKNKVKSE